MPEEEARRGERMMKLLTPVLTMATPFSHPSPPPRTRPAARPSGTGNPSACISHPLAITAQTPIEPTARLMPPVASTTICEKPMTMSMASERPSANRLKLDEKPGAIVEKTIQKTTTMTSSPICAEAPASNDRRRSGDGPIADGFVGHRRAAFSLSFRASEARPGTPRE